MTHRIARTNIFIQLAVSLAIFLPCAHSQAIPITYTTTGTILSGTDHGGGFSNGESDRELSGQSFSQSVTFDPSFVNADVSAPPDYTFVSGHIYSGNATSIITIGNISHSYTWDASKFLYAQVGLMNWLTQGDTARFDGVAFRTFGLTEDYTSVDVGSNVYSRSNPFHLGLNIDQNWSYNVHPEDMIQDAFASIYGPLGQVELQYTGRPESISMHVAEVPEPSPSALFVLGFAVLLVMRRKTQF